MLQDWGLRRVLWGRVLLLVLRLWLGFGVSRVGRLQLQASGLDYVSLKVYVSLILLLTGKRNVPWDLR